MKTILIGLDPGEGPWNEVLPAEGYSGGRLVRMMDLSGDGYARTFDKVNLHPGIRDHHDDRPSARNLLPLLEGRRVVFLGRRVAEAFGIRRPFLRWNVEQDKRILSCTIPHPSGKSRWWNDPRNRSDAEKFISRLKHPCLHVEGQDGSGKSKLVESLSRMMPEMELVPTEDPPSSWGECLRRIDSRIRPGILCDRSSGLISELAYGPVLRGGCVTDEATIWSMLEAIVHGVTFVYCRPPWTAIRPRFRQGEMPDHMRKVVERGMDLRVRYDEVMDRMRSMGAMVWSYDWTSDPVEDLVGKIRKGAERCVDSA